jgi:ATP/maltotriose-dependent transcriptional regulator MalT
LGIAAEDRGDSVRAGTLLADALAVFRSLNETSWIGFSLNALGLVARESGDIEQAENLFAEALAQFREIGELHGTSFALTNLGKVSLAAGNPNRAELFFREGLSVRREHGIQVAIAACLRGLAEVASAHGQYETTARLLGAAESLRESIGLPPPRQSDRSERAFDRASLGGELFESTRRIGREAPLVDVIRDVLERPIEPAGAPAAPGVVRNIDHGLSTRELDVLRLMVAGKTDQEIADALFISRRTVNTHTGHLYAKLGVANRVEATARAVGVGLTAPPAREI